MSMRCIRRFPLLVLLLIACATCLPTAKAMTNCSATTAGSLVFGNIPLTGMTDVSTTFTVTCSTTGFLLNTKVRMCLNIGEGTGGGGINPRRMLNGVNALEFQMYTNAGRSQVWGALDTAGSNPNLASFSYSAGLFGGNSGPQTFTIYGRVRSDNQVLQAGNYTSSFTGNHASITYQYNEAFLSTPADPASCQSGGDDGATIPNAFPLNVSATVPPNCRAYTTTDLNFGSVPGLITSNIDQASIIGMTCTKLTAWNVGLNNGQNASGISRRMRLGATANYVAYELYKDPGRTIRWGNTVNTDTLPGIGNGGAQSLTVYGRVAATQTVPAGSYSDVITVTVTY